MSNYFQKLEAALLLIIYSKNSKSCHFQLLGSNDLQSAKSMKRAYYADSIECFLDSSTEEILGSLMLCNDFELLQTQRNAWFSQIEILHAVLSTHSGSIYFEYSIPRMGRRIDVVAIIGAIIFVLNLKLAKPNLV